MEENGLLVGMKWDEMKVMESNEATGMSDVLAGGRQVSGGIHDSTRTQDGVRRFNFDMDARNKTTKSDLTSFHSAVTPARNVVWRLTSLLSPGDMHFPTSKIFKEYLNSDQAFHRQCSIKVTDYHQMVNL